MKLWYAKNCPFTSYTTLLEIKCLKHLVCFYCTSEHTWYSVYGTPGEVCLLHHIMVSSTHSCSGLSTPDLVCFYSTSQHTQYSVHSTPQVLCPEWQMLECSTHPLWCVLYTRCRAAHHSAECALDTAVNTVHTRYVHQIQCAMHSKNLHYSSIYK